MARRLDQLRLPVGLRKIMRLSQNRPACYAVLGFFVKDAVQFVNQFELTLEAFANFSPRLELATTLGQVKKRIINPEKGLPTAEPFQGWTV
jgi:hypothetical protein